MWACTNGRNKRRVAVLICIALGLVTFVLLQLTLHQWLAHQTHPSPGTIQDQKEATLLMPSSSSSSSSAAAVTSTAGVGRPSASNAKIPALPIQGWNITDDISWILDFAIVGFPKTGTSTLMLYLKQYTDSIFIFSQERCEMGYNQHVVVFKDLYKQFRQSQQSRRLMGLKCPRDLEVDLALHNYNQFLPRTKFIVGIRHPVLWFQSFYNFRIHNEFELPPPSRLIGRCKTANKGVCTQRANFAKHLQKIEQWRPVFLYDVTQLQQRTGSSGRFRNNLQQFLGLEQPMTKEMIWIKPGRTLLADANGTDTNAIAAIAEKKINICDAQHDSVREVLQRHAQESAEWILHHFLEEWNVQVPCVDQFRAIMDTWKQDPCPTRS
eukprot:CAMPEP_0198135926 /NCGR_PEP_ID=MMETSP1442-20131203/60841_1 /TAXON_ID= /ORGANISM="Craspedostauros australis, Strain CCMP3328" /LENGTH=379 /DNA_ID=CAMNT_0043797117 /DNA_START=1225 /DNA_END=2364 /DNA_ORIENTATION=-